jgi:hypothetical protein
MIERFDDCCGGSIGCDWNAGVVVVIVIFVEVISIVIFVFVIFVEVISIVIFVLIDGVVGVVVVVCGGVGIVVLVALICDGCMRSGCKGPQEEEEKKERGLMAAVCRECHG